MAADHSERPANSIASSDVANRCGVAVSPDAALIGQHGRRNPMPRTLSALAPTVPISIAMSGMPHRDGMQAVAVGCDGHRTDDDAGNNPLTVVVGAIGIYQHGHHPMSESSWGVLPHRPKGDESDV